MTSEVPLAEDNETPGNIPAAPAPLPVPTRPAGFLRRIAAFLVDGLVIGAVGLGVGALYGDRLSGMGGYERIIGFAIALAYAGLLNSGIAGGRTLGKRLLGLRVQGVDGGMLSVPRAMARQVVFSVPLFLNMAPFPVDVLASYWGVVLSVIVLGGILSTLYLFVFNRKTRRTLHDLATGSWVVRVGDLPPDVPTGPLWRGHKVVLWLVLVAMIALPLSVTHLMPRGLLDGIVAMDRALSAQPGVLTASAQIGVNYRSRGRQTEYVAVTVVLDHAGTDDEDRARAVAREVLRLYPEAAEKDVIAVTLVHGYDMVIASQWSRNSFNFDPRELK